MNRCEAWALLTRFVVVVVLGRLPSVRGTAKNVRLNLVRDRLGCKPFYWRCRKSRVLFGFQQYMGYWGLTAIARQDLVNCRDEDSEYFVEELDARLLSAVQ